ncbi:hypothetical protein CXG81DRAFT_8565 [Caulochytrium protostelioides]|uniref:Guanylate cyclase domain-containing protein n=1 Tax=Caulochytrium protostelioides TaxID=1555241 RepID=A0A4P9XG97_9FUNG|nr:hypothetical protein CXG81DRAFT_8565 [Caulochytrium protostelioides]|eukprot:RKP04200.1 hypothetical protein CXG81DRAFT_8565 [Caulochytrium protostelioides]
MHSGGPGGARPDPRDAQGLHPGHGGHPSHGGHGGLDRPESERYGGSNASVISSATTATYVGHLYDTPSPPPLVSHHSASTSGQATPRYRDDAGRDIEPDREFRGDAIEEAYHAQPGPSKIILQTGPRRGSAARCDDDANVARLVYHTSYGGKTNFTLNRRETTIGRKEDNHIPAEYYIRDRNSSNGVRINDRLIEANTYVPLKDHDVITVGTISLHFYTTAYSANDPFFGGNLLAKSTPAGPNGSTEDPNLKLVTILPSEKKYEDAVVIRTEMNAEDSVDFRKASDVEDISTLREDYEKLRLAHELSKVSLTYDITRLLAKSLNLIFEILPVDRGVVLLVDQTTGILGTHYVKLREGKSNEGREILLSSTILRMVYYSRKFLITSDACEDPMLGKAASVKHGQIHSVICVPLMAHNKVHGILHLDSRNRINSFSSKDLSLVKAISIQTAMAIENATLVKEVENKARMTEQLSRFLPPHVVYRMTTRNEIIRKGGREISGTIIFADIRGFTQLSERSPPAEIVALLNDYFERLVRIVFKYEGVVDKYIGDALMATFGTLEEETDAEFRSVAAALEFKTTLQEMNMERAARGQEAVAIGVGVNTGPLLAGFIGCSQRLEYTCIGDTVNTSSRICSMAQADQVLISDETYALVRDRILARPVGSRQFKGKTREVMVYEALGFKDPTEPSKMANRKSVLGTLRAPL